MAEGTREENVYMAKLAEQAERYDEMVEAMKKVACMDVELTVEERTFYPLHTRTSLVLEELLGELFVQLNKRKRAKEMNTTLPELRNIEPRLIKSLHTFVMTSWPS